MLQGKDLEHILPQAPPMLMIDTLVSSDTEKTVTGLTIRENNIFVFEGKFREAGLIENMAQTAAARAGYEALTNNTKVRTGYIGSIKNLSIYTTPKVNLTLQTTLVPVSNIGNISVVKTEVFSAEEKIAECSMTIILID
ncbi:MAG: 3-hydroxyacyl-ACP dehydratase [Chlorobi bacterium]|nr:3-hydroxyacyl-ACP dehydratase [Chlorobiota bacterium]